MCTNCRFFKKVEMIESAKLSNSKFIPGMGVILSSGLIFSKVKTVGFSDLEISDSIEGKTTLHNHALTSYLVNRFAVGNKKLCFRITDYNGNQFIIGTYQRPYPKITFTDIAPSVLSSKCAVKMSVNYLSTSVYPVLQG